MRFEAEFLNQDLHALLGVPSDASQQQIRAAYRLGVRASHPDLNPQDAEAGQRMALLNRAARVLLDPALRREYEQARRRAVHRAPGGFGCSPDWFDGSGAADGDWGAVECPAEPAPTRAQRVFSRRVRHAGSGAAARAQAILRSVGSERRLALAALCIALGSGLLVWSHPSNAFWTRAGTQTAAAGP